MARKMTLSFFLGFVLVVNTIGEITVSKAIAEKWGARCIDGKNPSYKLSRNPSSQSWIVMLEGMGWAWDYSTEGVKHYAASQTAISGKYPSQTPSATPEEVPLDSGDDTSEREWPQDETEYLGGFLSKDGVINPDFASWNKVYVQYCDFTGFASSRDEPILIDDRTGQPAWMYFRGRNNFNAVIDHLVSIVGMSGATDVILGGVSSGAASMFNLVDYLNENLGSGTRVTGFSDAGMFMDGFSATDGRHKFGDLMEASDEVWNVTGAGNINQNCAEAYPTEMWKCLVPEYVAQYVETPIFILNSKFDYWALGMADFEGFNTCGPDHWGDSGCSVDFASNLQQWTESLLGAVGQVMDSNPLNGAYIDSCVAHEQSLTYCCQDNSSPNCLGWHPDMPGSLKFGYTTSVEVNGQQFTPQQAFGDYYFKRTANNVIIDSSDVNHNPSCVYSYDNIKTEIKPPVESWQRYGGTSFVGGYEPFDDYKLPGKSPRTLSPVRRLRPSNI